MEQDGQGDLSAVVRPSRLSPNSITTTCDPNNGINWQISLMSNFSGCCFACENICTDRSPVSPILLASQYNGSSRFGLSKDLLRNASASALDLQASLSSPSYDCNQLRLETSSSPIFENVESTVPGSSSFYATADSPHPAFSDSVRTAGNDDGYDITLIPERNGKPTQSLDQIRVDMMSIAALSSPPNPGTETFQTAHLICSDPEPPSANISELERDCCSVRNVSTVAKRGSSKVQLESKRRKTQERRVVCIPAPGRSNKPSGEGVPSDLWAWRKYGQKPIKGSPHPRGYYRCSSCKGCPARKQVERSQTDPTMLAITYTCDHNHPWPTHRKALAGSTRLTTSSEEKTTISNTVPEKKDLIIAPVCEKSKMPIHPPQQNSLSLIIDSASGLLTHGDEGQSVSSLEIHDNYLGESFKVKEEVRPGDIHLFRSSMHGDDFFEDLGELIPDYLKVFESHFADENCRTVVDPSNLFN